MYTEIVVILDRSGSMIDAKSDHEGGLNSFISDQKEYEGKVKFTLVKFNGENPFDIVYNRTDIRNVDKIKLEPRGCTPLVEAVFRTVSYIKEQIENSEEKPSSVVFMIVTDGEENSSAIEYTNARLKELIKECENKSWVFMYLGANVDAFVESAKIGVSSSTSATYSNTDSKCVKYMYNNISEKMINTRCCTNGNTQDIFTFSEEERQEIKNGSVSGSSNSKSN